MVLGVAEQQQLSGSRQVPSARAASSSLRQWLVGIEAVSDMGQAAD